MYIAYGGERIEFIEAFIREVEQNRNRGDSTAFFRVEKKLLRHLFLKEKTEAHRAVREVINCIPVHGKSGSVNAVKYYLVSLSSMMARLIESNPRVANRAFTFNTACFMVIDSKLNDHNAVEVAGELIEFYMQLSTEIKRPKLMHNTVNNVISYIDERVETLLTVEDIAKNFNVSASHLSRIFRGNTGSTLVEYINIRKVEESQYYLRFSDKKIADISNQFFFCNQSYFTRIFKKYTGQTPREFRRSSAGDFPQFTISEEKNNLSTVNH
ncbi:AraC family transcriptional regulator [Sporosarcina sp. FSL K6-2383]|uniref:helix-turn-helix domain-containing protein n=1 Tax=Sporosarcina sp. FSL K6-2383 TaxID=2921556 RepID=UPI00315AD559